VPGLLTGFVFQELKNNAAARKKGADAPEAVKKTY
jgi:hypothetical protein